MQLSEFAGNLQVHLEMRNVRGVSWISYLSGFPEEGPKSKFDSHVGLDLDLPHTRLLESRDDVAADILREVFFALNWADVAATPAHLDRLLKSAYEYNMWQAS